MAADACTQGRKAVRSPCCFAHYFAQAHKYHMQEASITSSTEGDSEPLVTLGAAGGYPVSTAGRRAMLQDGNHDSVLQQLTGLTLAQAQQEVSQSGLVQCKQDML